MRGKRFWIEDWRLRVYVSSACYFECPNMDDARTNLNDERTFQDDAKTIQNDEWQF